MNELIFAVFSCDTESPSFRMDLIDRFSIYASLSSYLTVEEV